jgi:uncharacterized protein (DUF433 family)
VFLHDTKSFSGQTKTEERVTLAPTLLGLTVGVSLPRAVLVKHPGGVFNLHHHLPSARVLDWSVQITTISVVMTNPNRIVIDPAICDGKLVIQDTRLPVTVVPGSLAGGMTFEDVQREYDITADDIRAALRFVGELAEQEYFHQLPGA